MEIVSLRETEDFHELKLESQEWKDGQETQQKKVKDRLGSQLENDEKRSKDETEQKRNIDIRKQSEEIKQEIEKLKKLREPMI